MTPLATRLREVLGDPRPKRKADRKAWDDRGLLILRRDCAAVLALLDAAKESREVAAAAARVIASTGSTIAFLDACAKAGIADGFGVRLQSAIAALEEST